MNGKGAVIVVGCAAFKSAPTKKSGPEGWVYISSRFNERGRSNNWEIWGHVMSA